MAGSTSSLILVYPSLFLYFFYRLVFPCSYLIGGTIPTSLLVLVKTIFTPLWQWIPFWLEMEPPDADRVVVGSRDHSLASSLKERVSNRNLISQSACPGVDILSRFLNV